MIQTKIDLKIRKVNIKMEESLNSLIKIIDSQAQKDTKELIRTKIYKEIDELRKNDEFSKRFEMEEIKFFKRNLGVLIDEDKNLNKLVYIYEYLNDFSNTNDYLKDLLNKE